MKYLSLFSGIEAASVAWEPLGWEPVAFCEIAPHPSAVLAHHWPDVPNFGDIENITELDIKFLEGIDLVIGGSPCFISGTKVLTENGHMNIEDVRKGDKVLTHENRFKKVLRVGGKKSQPIYTLKASGVMPTGVTAEHPYYVRKMQRVWDNSTRRNVRVLGEHQWVAAKDLVKDDFLAMPVLQDSKNPMRLTSEECFIIGRYIADGHTRKDFKTSEGRGGGRHWQLILSVGSHKLHVVEDEIVDNHYSCYKHTENVHRVVFSSKRLVEIVEANCGVGAGDKYLSQMLLSLPVDLLKRVIDGYLSGDGYKKGAKWQANTISPDLITTMQLAITKVYNTAPSYNFYERPKKTVIQGRTVNQKDTHTFMFYESAPKQANYIHDGDMVWVRFKSLDHAGYKDTVYNMEVEGDNSYTANNLVVHNCQNLSVAGNGKGLGGEQSKLFYEQMRVFDLCRRVHGTRFLLWENVPGARTTNKGADFGQVVKEMAGLRDISTPKNGWGTEGCALGDNGLLEWATLDAQFFGLAQRRKRIFALLDTGDWASRPPILLERESVRGDTAPSREAIKEATGSTGAGSAASGSHWDNPVNPHPTLNQSHNTGGIASSNQEVFSQRGAGLVPITAYDAIGFSAGNSAKAYGVGASDEHTPPLRAAASGTNQVPTVAYSIKATAIGRKPENGGNGMGISEEVSDTLTATDRHAVTHYEAYQHHNWRESEVTGTLTANLSRGVCGDTPLVKELPKWPADIACTLNAAFGSKLGLEDQHINGGAPLFVLCASSGQTNAAVACELAHTLNTTNEGQYLAKHPGIVRRLTPIECARLQGFPDNHAQVPYKGKPMPDGQMYKMFGNSMAVPVINWIGRQIDQALSETTIETQ